MKPGRRLPVRKTGRKPWKLRKLLIFRSVSFPKEPAGLCMGISCFGIELEIHRSSRSWFFSSSIPKENIPMIKPDIPMIYRLQARAQTSHLPGSRSLGRLHGSSRRHLGGVVRTEDESMRGDMAVEMAGLVTAVQTDLRVRNRGKKEDSAPCCAWRSWPKTKGKRRSLGWYHLVVPGSSLEVNQSQIRCTLCPMAWRKHLRPLVVNSSACLAEV